MIRALPLLALLLATPVLSQTPCNDDGNAPVHLDAGTVDLQSRADRLSVSGGVIITQGSRKLQADRVTIAYSGLPDAANPNPDINRVDALGNVVFTRCNQVARGKMAVYDLEQRIITILGDVSLTEGARKLAGDRLVIDLTSGRANMEGRSPTPGVPAGRVTGTFTVPGKNKP